MATKSTKGAASLPQTGTYRKVLSHDEKANFWKPTRFGEKIMGKLLALTVTKLSPVLQVQVFSGDVQQVGVSTQLKRVPWAEYVGKEIAITYAASAKSQFGKDVKLFDVEVAD